MSDPGCAPSCAQGPGPRIVDPGRAIIAQLGDQSWEYQLQAACGIPPYQWGPYPDSSTWSYADLDPSGRLEGTPVQPTACPEPLTVTVTDQQGRTDRGTFYLIIAPDAG